MRLAAESIGLGAAEILSAGVSGAVIAVFTRSLYLRFPAGLLCLGTQEIGRGPINVPCHSPALVQFESGVIPGMPAAVTDGAVQVGQLRIALDTAATWSPPSLPAWSADTARAGIARLRAGLLRKPPEGGLGTILVSPAAARRSDHPVLRTAVPAIDRLVDWVEIADTVDPPEAALCNLLGLGPGLTPSGDDFLGGVLVALLLAGRNKAAGKLGKAIERLGPERTNEISMAHMRAVIRFGLVEKLHEVVADILRGEAGAPSASLARLSKVSHHSPWDTLAGLIAVFSALSTRSNPISIADESEV